MAPRISILNDKQMLTEAIANSNSLKEVLAYLDLRAAGGNYSALKKAAVGFGLELPKYDRSTSIRPREYSHGLPDAHVFVENSNYVNRSSLKKRMYLMGYKEECSECGLGPEWNGKPITLQLDHINGVHNDNRLENLRIICPNCHSQTETFAGRKSIKDKIVTLQKRNLRKIAEGNHVCMDCDTPIFPKLKRCPLCAETARQSRYGIDYPEIDVLIEKLTATNFVQVAKELGVSDNALRKHVRKFIDESHPLLNKYKKKTAA